MYLLDRCVDVFSPCLKDTAGAGLIVRLNKFVRGLKVHFANFIPLQSN